MINVVFICFIIPNLSSLYSSFLILLLASHFLLLLLATLSTTNKIYTVLVSNLGFRRKKPSLTVSHSAARNFQKTHHRDHKIKPFDFIPSWFNPVHISQPLSLLRFLILSFRPTGASFAHNSLFLAPCVPRELHPGMCFR